jgi:IPT/TIG domain
VAAARCRVTYGLLGQFPRRHALQLATWCSPTDRHNNWVRAIFSWPRTTAPHGASAGLHPNHLKKSYLLLPVVTYSLARLSSSLPVWGWARGGGDTGCTEHVTLRFWVVVAVAVAAGAGAGGAPALAAPLTPSGPAATGKPVIDSIQPSTGGTAGGTAVQIFGGRLKGATSVNFGSSAASITSDSASEVDVVSPAHASGTVDITVTTAAGTSTITGNDLFTYSNQPTVQSLTPSQGPAAGGTEVQIFGTLFTGATAVHFGTAAASGITVVSSTEIDVLSPAVPADGTVDVTVTGPGGTSAINPSDEFTYDSIPAVSDLSVNTGPTAGGTAVQIFGVNFTGTTAVHFGTASASIQNVSDTEVDVTSPAGSAGAVDVTVTTQKGTSPITGGGRVHLQ